MPQRRHILINKYEEATDTILREAAERWRARVFAKVRVADAVGIAGCGLTGDEYSYALKAHFDFVVEHEDEAVVFAVEFDGRTHEIDPSVIARDALKESICKKADLPLLRVDDGYLRRIGRFALLGWMVEVWFLYHDFYRRQEEGLVPEGEVFHYGMVLAEFDGQREIAMPYDPFIRYRAEIWSSFEKCPCLDPVPHIVQARDPLGFVVTQATIRLPEGSVLMGLSRCRSFNFSPIDVWELGEELATVDVADKLRCYVLGRCDPDPDEAVQRWHKRLDAWEKRGPY